MSLFENIELIRSLKTLLSPNDDKDEYSDSDGDEPRTAFNTISPATVGAPAKTNENNKLVSLAAAENKEVQPTCIEEWQELQEKEDSDILDSRKCPEYKLRYRQSVGTEDVFLQMGNRTSATASCEDMVLEIELPGDNTPLEQMELGITEKEINFGSQLYRLKLPLVQTIDVHKTRAQYQTERNLLVLTLRLKREFDFANF